MSCRFILSSKRGVVKLMPIPWYKNDHRFEPGTVADVGYSLRLSLSKSKSKSNEWRLLMAIRTREKDGIANALRPSVRVALFKECKSLNEAQSRSEIWFDKWRQDLF